MNNALKVSVVVCSYNRAAYIADAMQSLYQQTLSKDQYITAKTKWPNL